MSDPYYPYAYARPNRLYNSPTEFPGRYKWHGNLPRDIKVAIAPRDWAECVEIAAKLCSRIPVLRGAIRQKSEWAFAGDSWTPIYYGQHELWGDIVTDWLVHTVFPQALRGNTRKDLIKAMQVSGMSWDIHGDDLAIFTCEQKKGLDGQVLDANEKPLPQMAIIPGTRIGNGPMAGGDQLGWMQTVSGGVYTAGSYSLYGVGECVGGEFAGKRIYNGVIFDDGDEPVAVRVLGMKRSDTGVWQSSYTDFRLGFQYGTHLASEYEWHNMGRPLPRIAASILHWMNKEQIDDNFLREIELASRQTVIHKLAEGQDIQQSRGDSVQQITVAQADGTSQTILVDTTEAGDVKYISSAENLEGLQYENPHPNVEDFARRVTSECLQDLGWPAELTDLSSTSRAPTRLSCELVNNSLWQKQVTGETRLMWFVKFAIASGIKYGHIPQPPAGPLDEPFKWTFGYPREMSVDTGNDIKAWLDLLKMGLTSQRITSAKLGHIHKRIRRDRQREVDDLLNDVIVVKAKIAAAKLDIPDQKIVEFFYQSSPNSSAVMKQVATDTGTDVTETNSPTTEKKDEKKKAAQNNAP